MASLESTHVGTSGWAYPSWKPGFYPAELNTTGYRLPAEEQFGRWADAVPPGFTFAPKLPGNRPGIVSAFSERVRHLGEHLGPVRVVLTSPRDDGMLTLLLGSLDPGLRLAFDLQDESWDGVEPLIAEAGAVRVNDTESPAPFRYLRLREPPYDDEAGACDAADHRGTSVGKPIRWMTWYSVGLPGWRSTTDRLLSPKPIT